MAQVRMAPLSTLDMIYEISAPKAPRTTVALRQYPYDREGSKKTQTRYFGSFNLGLDPSAIPADGEVRPGEKRFGISLRPDAPNMLTPDDLAHIRAWLHENGLLVRRAAEAQAAQAAAVEAQERERMALMVETERRIRASVEAQVRAELEASTAASAVDPLKALENALVAAARNVRERVARLEEAGHTLERSRDWRQVDESNPFDVLWQQTSRIRLEVYPMFESACQDAKLMARRGKSDAGR